MNRRLLVAFGILRGYLYRWITNLWFWTAFIYPLILNTFILTQVNTIWFDTFHAIGNGIFLGILGMKTIAISEFKATCCAVLQRLSNTGGLVLVTRWGERQSRGAISGGNFANTILNSGSAWRRRTQGAHQLSRVSLKSPAEWIPHVPRDARGPRHPGGGMIRSQTVRLLQCPLPSETQMGSPGEQPIKAYLAWDHQDDGQGVGSSCSPRTPFQAHRIDTRLMPEEDAKHRTASLCPGNRAAHPVPGPNGRRGMLVF